MPTLPTFDPSNLPPYPEKPHKTGQARVNVDGKSQYLGKYGTVESHALYHLACARKLITGMVPSTKELRDEISKVAGHEEPRGAQGRTLMTMIATILVVALTSGVLSHYLTKATLRKAPVEIVVAEKPILNTENRNSDVGDSSGDVDNRFSQVFPLLETSVVEMRKEYPDAIPIAVVEKVKSAMERMLEKKPEGSQRNDTEVEGRTSRPD